MEKWKLTSAAVVAACAGESYASPEMPTAQELYSMAKQKPSVHVPDDVTQSVLHKSHCTMEAGNAERYVCQVSVAYYLQSGEVLIDKQELHLSWKEGQWQQE